MFESTKRSLLNVVETLLSGQPLKKQRLVAYRSRASNLAKHRVDELEQLFGTRLQCYSDIYLHESAYYMVKECWASYMGFLRKLYFVGSFLYGSFSLAAFCSLLLRSFRERLSLDLDVKPFAISIFIILAILGAWATKGFIGLFRAESRGHGDHMRSDELRRTLYVFAILSGIYFFGFGIAFSWLPWFRSLAAEDVDTALLALFVGAIGAFGMSVCFATWLCVTGMESINRFNNQYFIVKFPVEVILHELISSACLLRSVKGKKLSFRMQRNWNQHIELAARAVELGLQKQILVGDRFSSSQIAARLGNIANGFRDLKIWLATPKPDTYIHLERL